MMKMTKMIFECVEESRQPWAIFQFPFFFGQVDNKESKNKYRVTETWCRTWATFF